MPSGAIPSTFKLLGNALRARLLHNILDCILIILDIYIFYHYRSKGMGEPIVGKSSLFYDSTEQHLLASIERDFMVWWRLKYNIRYNWEYFLLIIVIFGSIVSYKQQRTCSDNITKLFTWISILENIILYNYFKYVVMLADFKT